jgi:hypothetical protein
MGLELDALAESHYFPHVFAYQRLFGDVLVGYHVIALTFDHPEEEGANGEALVMAVGFLFGLAHEVDAEVHAIFVEDVLELLQVYQ